MTGEEAYWAGLDPEEDDWALQILLISIRKTMPTTTAILMITPAFTVAARVWWRTMIRSNADRIRT